MKRLVYAEDVTSTVVMIGSSSDGIFSVPSEMGNHSYNIYFQAPHDNEIPSCECLDWQKHYLPCKHMLAIIQNRKYDTWGWEKLPAEYRESPFLTLDFDVLFKPIEHNLDKINESQDQQGCSAQCGTLNKSAIEGVTKTATTELPKPVFPKRTAVTRCCDLLSRIKNLVYECTNSTSLANLEKSLLVALRDLEDSSNTDLGLTLPTLPLTLVPDTSRSLTSRCNKRKSCKSDSKPKKKQKISKLPTVQTTKKHPYNKRVGQHAAMMKKFFKTQLSLEDMEKTELTCNDTNTNDPPVHYTSFTPIIREGSSLTAALLSNGPHSVSLLEMKSLEPFLPNGTQNLLSSVSATTFKPGWLYDEIINSYFWCLQEKYENVLYAASTSMLSIQRGGQAGRLWTEDNNEREEFIIAPWNPSDYHWVFVGIDLQEKKIVYLDPLNSATEIQNSAYMQILSEFLPSLLERKFGVSGFQLTSPQHTLQPDFSSCGVLVCWYASQFVQRKSLSDSCDSFAMRFLIYNEIRGTCLRRRSGSRHLELSKCPFCRALVLEDTAKLECKRCCQCYHVLCISSEEQPVGERSEFYCPTS